MGNLSVRDHLAPEAYLREALVFDRLVIPYPNPYVRESGNAGSILIPTIRG
jgi:hypothetical protein